MYYAAVASAISFFLAVLFVVISREISMIACSDHDNEIWDIPGIKVNLITSRCSLVPIVILTAAGWKFISVCLAVSLGFNAALCVLMFKLNYKIGGIKVVALQAVMIGICSVFTLYLMTFVK